MRSMLSLVAALVAGVASAFVPVQSKLVSEVRVYGPVPLERATATDEAGAKRLAGEGRRVSLGGDEAYDLAKITGAKVPKLKNREGCDFCAYLAFGMKAEKPGEVRLYYCNNWFGQLFVNGRKVAELEGPWNSVFDTAAKCHMWDSVVISLAAGENEILFRSRPGSDGNWLSAFAVGESGTFADFGTEVGAMRPRLHAASWGPRSSNRGLVNDDDDLRALTLHGFRTHDAPLVCKGQRVVDTHFVFPLMHLDAKDPRNYVFEPTDHLFDLVEGVGMKILYRLGTSIEHSGDWGFNTLNPPDHDKYAEVLAGIVRRYVKGWGGGRPRPSVEAFELFNEPDVPMCWRGTWDEFAHLFVTCLKRLKSEFPDVKVGGPAFGSFNPKGWEALHAACREAGVAPDFFSWHHYGNDPVALARQPAIGRTYLDKYGFTKCETMINEWHFLPDCGWNGVQAADSLESVRRAQEGRGSTTGIDSAAYAAAVESRFHDTCLDSAYYYGCGYQGNWGYRTQYRELNKPYFAMKAMGELIKGYPRRVKTLSPGGSVTLFGGLAADGRSAALLVTDYRGKSTALDLDVRGLDGWRLESVRVLDDRHDLVADKALAASFANGRLRLAKSEPGSAVFLVRFCDERTGR